jgi:hypothetical protein
MIILSLSFTGVITKERGILVPSLTTFYELVLEPGPVKAPFSCFGDQCTRRIIFSDAVLSGICDECPVPADFDYAVIENPVI